MPSPELIQEVERQLIEIEIRLREIDSEDPEDP